MTAARWGSRGASSLEAMHEAAFPGTLLDTIDPALPGAERSRMSLERFATDRLLAADPSGLESGTGV